MIFNDGNHYRKSNNSKEFEEMKRWTMRLLGKLLIYFFSD